MLNLSQFKHRLSYALLPRTRCALCASACSEHSAALCESCKNALLTPRPRCVQCAAGLGMASASRYCGACISAPPAYEQTLCIADYQPEIRSLLLDFKFHRKVGLAAGFAQELVLLCACVPANALVIPVPLSPERLKERGYNQSWEIAKQLAKKTGRVAKSDVLLRAHHSPPQSTLAMRERYASVKNAFVCPHHFADAPPILLVDDVMTSGATLQACAKALKQAGASSVINLVLFRVG